MEHRVADSRQHDSQHQHPVIGCRRQRQSRSGEHADASHQHPARAIAIDDDAGQAWPMPEMVKNTVIRKPASV
jgi:hypothetical protein